MQTRREFLEFLGHGLLASGVLAALPACRSLTPSGSAASTAFSSLPVYRGDEFKTVDGLKYQMLASWGDVINSKKELFGSHADYISYFPFDEKNPLEGYLWVNHEYFDPQFSSGFQRNQKIEAKTLAQVQVERKEVGGSLLHVRKNSATQKWEIVQNDKINRRYDATTPIPFSSGVDVLGKEAMGTLGNCCGGLTPWGSFLSCEENFQNFYGSVSFDDQGQRTVTKSKSIMAWDRQDAKPPEHYGWVCEIEPKSGSIKKHPSLGRFAHEGATVVQTSDGRAVVYMGDDAADEHFYKFVAAETGSLVKGTLYVAVMTGDVHQDRKGKGSWVPLDVQNPLLKGKFKSQTELLIRTREAAKIVQAAGLDRPEDCKVDPKTKYVYLCCTNSSKYKRYHGYILKFMESGNDHAALSFDWEVFMKGSEETSFSSPDNLSFDSKGNLWVMSDMPDDDSKNYQSMGNNSLFYIPMSGNNQGKVYRVASAPRDAELTGLWFAPDQETAFLSVQHPGSTSKSPKPIDLTSNWPRGGSEIPRSSVIVLEGPLLKDLLGSGSAS